MNDMRTEKPEGAQVSVLNLTVLVALIGFGAALGGFLARFVAPQSDLGLFLGAGLFPAALLLGGVFIEEFWFMGLWKHQPHWDLEIDDRSASPAMHAERQRAAIFIPFGAVVGVIGGLAISALGAMPPLWATVSLYGLAGLGFGGVVYSLIQFGFLPRLGHGTPVRPPAKQKESIHHKPKFEEGRPEF